MHYLKMTHTVGEGATLELAEPQRLWRASDRPIGGGEESAAGIPSNYVIRYQPILRLAPRIRESEWAAYVQFLRDVDGAGASFTVILKNEEEDAVSYTVWVESPSVAKEQEIEYEREDNYPSILNTELVLKRTTPEPFDVPFYD